MNEVSLLPDLVTIEDWLVNLQKKEKKQSSNTTHRYVYELSVSWKDEEKVSEWHDLISHRRICWMTSFHMESDPDIIQMMFRMFEYMWSYSWKSMQLWDRSLFDWMSQPYRYSITCSCVMDANTVTQLVEHSSCHIMYHQQGTEPYKKLPIRVYDIHQLLEWYIAEHVPEVGQTSSGIQTVSSIWNQSV